MPTYIGIFPVYLVMPLIFINFLSIIHMVMTHFLLENLQISELYFVIDPWDWDDLNLVVHTHWKHSDSYKDMLLLT